MAKARKKARKSVPRRSAKKTRRTAAKLKGRKVAKGKANRKAGSKPRTKAPKQGVIAGAVQTVTETLGLHNRLAGRNTFED